MSETKNPDHIYRVSFINQDQVYELYAKSVTESDMFGFLEVSEFVFGNHTSLVVDPSEERLKLEFEGIKCSYIPMHTVIRIDEVTQEGIAKIRDAKDMGNNISQFPKSHFMRPMVEED